MKHVPYLITGLLLGTAPYTFAQTNTCKSQISFTILDNDQSPIIGANTQLNHKSSLTNVDGQVTFSNLCLGIQHLHIESAGFQPIDTNINLQSIDTAFTISLAPINQLLSDVQIIGHKPMVRTLNAIQKLDGTSIDRMSGQSIANMAAQLPGVNILQTGATIAKPMINGLSGNRILIVNNGSPQRGQQWGNEHAPEMEGTFLNDITLIKGAEAVEYGPEAMGGVLLINPRPLDFAKSPTINGQVNANFYSNGRQFQTGAFLEGGISKSSHIRWNAQFNYNQAGNYKTPDYYLSNTGFHTWNGAFQAGIDKKRYLLNLYLSYYQTAAGIFSGAHVGDTADLFHLIENGHPLIKGGFSYNIDAPKQTINHTVATLSGHYHLNDTWDLDGKYSFQNDNRAEYDLRRGDNKDKPSMDLSLMSHQFNLKASYKSKSYWRGSIGINSDMQINNNAPGTFVTPIIPNYDQWTTSIFTHHRYLKKQFQLAFGVRYDRTQLDVAGYNSLKQYFSDRKTYQNIAGNIGISYAFNNLFSLKSNIGSGWRAPNISELFSQGLHHGTAQIEYGNSELHQEQNYSWSTSLNYANLKKTVRLEASGYYNYINDFIYLTPTHQFSQTIRGAFPIYQYEQTNAQILGGDVQMDIQITPQLKYEPKGTLIFAKDLTKDSYLPNIPTHRWNHKLTYQFKDWKQLHQPYVAISNDVVAKQTRYTAQNELVNPPAGYSLLHFFAGTDWTLKKQQISINLAINNVFNTSYRDYLNAFRYYALEKGRNVQLNVQWKF